jgi:hypothetical protein
MFFGVSKPGKVVYGLTGREQQSETKKREITEHLLNLRIFEQLRMLGIRKVCPDSSRQAGRFKQDRAKGGVVVEGIAADDSSKEKQHLKISSSVSINDVDCVGGLRLFRGVVGPNRRCPRKG